MITNLPRVIGYLYPTAIIGTDYIAVNRDDGAGPVLDRWNTVALGAQPNQSALETAEASAGFATFWSPAAIEARANVMTRAEASAAIDADRAALWKTVRAAAAVLVDEVNMLLSAVPRPITSITRSGTTATATTPTAHGMSTGQSVSIFGATLAAYNGTKTITVTGATTFTYAGVSGNPATPATGTILYALTSAALPLSRTLAQAKTAIQTKIAAGTVD